MKRRIFLAIPATETFSSALLEKLKPFYDLPIKFIKPELWHLTLIFLGYLDDEEIMAIKKIAEEASNKFPKFILKTKNIVLFPDNRSRMLWLNFMENRGALELVIWLDAKINALKSETELFQEYKPINRAVHIHLNLARFEPGEGNKVKEKFYKLNLAKVSGFEKELLIDRIQIMESKLSKEGARYSVLNEFELCEKSI